MELSYKDALTGIGNRFAMTDYIRQMDRKQSVAVVYCDATGLKQVNDTQGHEAGDTLIRNALNLSSRYLMAMVCSALAVMNCW